MSTSLSDRVIVVNARKLDTVPEGYTRVYVGRRTSYRPEFGEDFSVLGNPFTMPRYSREDAIKHYSEHLRAQTRMSLLSPAIAELLDVLIARVATGERLALVCWCAPLACHADVIVREIEAAVPDQAGRDALAGAGA